MSQALAGLLYETGDVAHTFNVSTSLVHKWRKSGKIVPLRTVGGRYLFTEAHLATIRTMRAGRTSAKTPEVQR